jgi:hypothetical protein
MSDLSHYTHYSTRGHAYLFAHLLRALFQANRASMGDRWNHLGVELGNALAPLIYGAPTVMGAITAICARWSLITSPRWGSVKVVVPRSLATAWAFPRLEQYAAREDTDTDGEEEMVIVNSDSPFVGVSWHDVAVRLDIERVRRVVKASPQIFGALVREYVAPAERLGFVADSTLFDWVSEETAAPAGIDLSGFVPPHRAHARIVLTSPLSHGGDGGGSNIQAMRKEDRVDLLTGETRAIPFVAGGAVRGVLRDLVMVDYLRLLGLTPQEIRPQLAHALLAGGAIEAGAGMGATDNEQRATVRRLCPPIDLLGGMVDGQLMQGALLVGDALLVCRETAVLVAPAMGWSVEEARAKAETLPRADACLVQRHAVRSHHHEVPGPSQQMIMHVEALAAGHTLAHSLGLRTGQGTPVQRACVARMVGLAQEHGKLGGKGQAGFGDVAWGPYTDHGEDVFDFGEPYRALFDDQAFVAEARAWCIDGFAEKPKPEKAAKKPGKGRKGGGDAVAA